ncbi:MAG: copper amine oxidase N-terminal domain-containing protein [Peptoniphilus sp.]|nr:copper amine oxidase N-terminal domain-containing protein [Peptoniphilus sp.]MDD7363467.1 copper amine oxidase N-terminal domain-containing protein [Bacillota bacterium]MDY6044829.1 copper amine oxidase N-terminal domain-containing protein [Peptoniphilus sp.]
MKFSIKSFVFLTVFFFILSATAYAESNLHLVVDGEYVATDVPPFIENDRTLVPVRFVSERLNAAVDWDQKTRQVTVSKDDGSKIELAIGSDVSTVYRDGKIETVPLDVPAKLVKSRTFVPLRFIAESMGKDVDWDPETRAVIIGDASKYHPPAFPKTLDASLILNGKRAGTVQSVVKDGTLYVDVGTLNRKIIQYFHWPDMDGMPIREYLDYIEPSGIKPVNDGSGAWFCLTWPGSLEFSYLYDPGKNLLIEAVDPDDFGYLEYIRPLHRPILRDERLYMDLRLIANTLPFTYDIDASPRTLILTQQPTCVYDDWSKIYTAGYEYLEEVIASEF